MDTVFLSPVSSSIAHRPMERRSRSDDAVAEAVRSAAQKRQTEELQRADAEVKAHEAAHMAALGGGAASYTYVLGPDGTRYAVGGSVDVDLKEVPGDPEATIQKAKAVIRAAYAVGQPSGADIRVAAEAYVMEKKAQAELEESRAGGQREWWA